MKKFLLMSLLVMCANSNGMLLHDSMPFQSKGFDFKRLGTDSIRVSSVAGSTLIQASLLGAIFLPSGKSKVENQFVQKIKQDGNFANLKQGILDFLQHEEEEDALKDIMETPVIPLSVAEIIENITLSDGVIYSPSRDSIFNGSALSGMVDHLDALKRRIRESVDYYDGATREQLVAVLKNEVSALNSTVIYAYDELPEYSRDQVENYILYYTQAMSKLNEIVEYLNR